MRGQCSVSCEIFTIHNTFEVTKAMAEAIREYIKNAHARPGTKFGKISVRQQEYPPELDGRDGILDTWAVTSRLFSSNNPAERDSREWKDKKDLVEALGQIPASPYIEIRMFSNLYGEKFWGSWFDRYDCPELRQNVCRMSNPFTIRKQLVFWTNVNFYDMVHFL